MSVAIPADATADTIADLFTRERADLLALLHGLAADDWDRPTPCPEWNVLGLAAHLLGDDLGYISRNRDQHFGTPPPDGVDESGFIDWLDALQIEWVHAARRLSPTVIVELLEWTGQRVADTIRAEDPTALTASVTWASDEPVPVWLDHLRELSEYWIHRQQLHDALGQPADLHSDAFRPIIHGLRWAFAFRLSQLRPPIDGPVHITITEPLDERWCLAAGTDGWAFVDYDGTPPIAAATLTGDQAWRLLTNNLESATDLAIEGDPRVIETLRRTRAIIGQPDGA